MAECPACKKKFEWTSSRSKRIYCSVKCQNGPIAQKIRADLRRKKKSKIKECPGCKKQFETHKKNRTFCDTCSIIQQKIRSDMNKELRTRECPTCKKQFETTRSNKIYCSKKCSDTAPTEMKCVMCGKTFVSYPQRYSKVCSKKCQRNKYLKRYPPRASKVCGYCKIEKKYDKFRITKPNRSGPQVGKVVGWRTTNNDYRASRCLACEKKEFQIRYEKNPFPQMRSNANIRAKESGSKFDISTEYIKSIFPKDGRCPVLGVKFDMTYKKGRTYKYAPSLDKIIPEKGYVEGNVKVVSIIVNRIKSDANYKDMEKILKYYLKNKQFTEYFYKKEIIDYKRINKILKNK